MLKTSNPPRVEWVHLLRRHGLSLSVLFRHCYRGRCNGLVRHNRQAQRRRLWCSRRWHSHGRGRTFRAARLLLNVTRLCLGHVGAAVLASPRGVQDEAIQGVPIHCLQSKGRVLVVPETNKRHGPTLWVLANVHKLDVNPQLFHCGFQIRLGGNRRDEHENLSGQHRGGGGRGLGREGPKNTLA